MAEATSAFPNGSLSLALLMERFKLRKGEGETLIGDCPVDHGVDATFDCRPTDSGWRITFCELGCLPREIWDAARPIDQREPGEDSPSPEAQKPGLEQYAISQTIQSLRAEPPKREYLLTVASSGAGVLACGQVGMIAARGGSGKSNALMQLGVAVATGTTWFGAGRGWATRQGRALMLFAEEDRDEVERRRYFALRAAGILSEPDLQLVVDNLVLMPMRGLGVSLAGELDHGALPITERAIQIRKYLEREAQEGRPFSLVALDPLARFAGADVEIDNHAATRFIEVCETFTATECGRPNVCLAHHSRKLMVKDGDPESADAIRGPTGLVDAVRWAAVMVRKKGSLLARLRVVKTNYAAEPEPLVLAKVEGCHGALEAVDPDVEGVDTVREVDFELQRLVYDEIVKEPSSGNELQRQLHRKLEDVLQACADLKTAGRIERRGRKWIASNASQSLPGKR